MKFIFLLVALLSIGFNIYTIVDHPEEFSTIQEGLKERFTSRFDFDIINAINNSNDINTNEEPTISGPHFLSAEYGMNKEELTQWILNHLDIKHEDYIQIDFYSDYYTLGVVDVTVTATNEYQETFHDIILEIIENPDALYFEIAGYERTSSEVVLHLILHNETGVDITNIHEIEVFIYDMINDELVGHGVFIAFNSDIQIKNGNQYFLTLRFASGSYDSEFFPLNSQPINDYYISVDYAYSKNTDND